MNREADAVRIPCAICGGTAIRELYLKMGYSIGRCLACGLIQANPRAPQETILSRYSRDYFWKEYLPSLGVIDGQYDLDQFDLRYRAMLEMIAARTPGRRLLEVGCGAGFFLKAAERAGWTAEGIELSEEAWRFGTERLHVRIQRERADVAPVQAASFDVAAMFDVIEHLFDPRAVLAAAARALVPGGTLVITTPNINSASRYLLGPHWAVLSPREHVYYFSENSLGGLLKTAGFADVRFVREHLMWGPEETINFRYTHALNTLRTRATEKLVRLGDKWLARKLQRAGRQDVLLCFARRS